MRRVARMGRVALLLGLTFVLAAAAIWGAGSLLIRPHRQVIGAPPGDFPARDVTFASDTGLPVRGWFVPGRPGMGAVLLLHGVRANRLSMLARARFLHRAGYAVLLIDFQASGESAGEAISFGYREARDAVAAVRELRELAPGEPVGVIGTSMGGAAALLAGASLDADAVVLEQVYPSIDRAVRDRLELHGGAVGRWAAVPLLATMHPHLGVYPEQLRPIDWIGMLTVPKLLIVGERDRHTRIEESMEMYGRAAGPKALWVVAGAEHVDLYRFAGDAYEMRVLAFLGCVLRRETSGACDEK